MSLKPGLLEGIFDLMYGPYFHINTNALSELSFC